MAAEQLRQTLLRETGVICWFPRYALPGAAPSHEVCIQAREVAQPVPELLPDPLPPLKSAPAAESAQMRSAGIGHVISGRAAAAEVLSTLKASKAPAVSPKQVSTPAPLLPPPHIIQHVEQPFGFSWFAVDKRLSVLAMLPSGASRLSTNCQVMLQRMLIALHDPWQSHVLEEQSFHWPFTDDPGLLADANAARQAVEGFIARRLRVQHSAMLLVLCDQLPWFLQQSFTDAQEIAPGQLKIHRQYDLAMLCTHSLHTMEQDAALKRAAWQCMQVLRERLGRT